MDFDLANRKFIVALVLFAALAAGAWRTIEHEKFRNATLLVLGMFAVLTFTGYKRQAAAKQDRQER